MLHTVKGAIFDMDGTLINSLILWEVFWDAFSKAFLDGRPFAPTKEDDKAVRTMTLRDAMCYIHDRYGVGDSGETLFSLSTEILDRFYRSEVQLKPGVTALLSALQKRGVPMCIASAGERELVETALAHCGIRPYFSAIVSCADVGHGKDAPDVYLAALSVLGTAAAETCVFEDSLVAIRTAHSLGMQTVGVYDACNYGGDEMEKIATAYIGKGEDFEKLLLP